MGKIVFITGGARSGKSTFAESMLNAHDNVVYIATAIPFDEEMKERIKIHRSRRNSNWQTFESYKNIASIISKADENTGYILLDCLTIMISNLMIIENGMEEENINSESAKKTEKIIESEIQNIIISAKKFKGKTIIVSNEVGMSIVPAAPLGRYFRDVAGRSNQTVAQSADEVYLMISGIPVKIKG